MQTTFEQDFALRHQAVENRLREACAAAGRDRSSVILMAVTKTHPLEKIYPALQAGLIHLGENRVQEAREKIPQCNRPAQWELIGQLQSNKAKLAASLFQRIQSVDRAKLVRILDQEGRERGSPVRILMQVNTSGEAQKSGVAPAEAPALADLIIQSPGLQWEGLMAIGPLAGGPSTARPAFAALRQIAGDLRVRTGAELPVLSMGMTGDLEEAIHEGSTLVRVGTALFAGRNP